MQVDELPGTSGTADADRLVSADGLAVHVTIRGDVVLVGIRGEVDDLTLPALARAFDLAFSARPTRVAVDAGSMTFCSVRGFAVLLVASDRAAGTGAAYGVGGLSALQARMIWTGWPHRDPAPFAHASLADAVCAPHPPVPDPADAAGRAESVRLRHAVRTRATVVQADDGAPARAGEVAMVGGGEVARAGGGGDDRVDRVRAR